MCQVSRRLEVGNHKRRTLNTQLSSGTSAGTFACPAGPYRNCKGEVGTENEPNWYFEPDPEKGPKIDPHVLNLRSCEFLFQGVKVQAVHPSNGSLVPLIEVLCGLKPCGCHVTYESQFIFHVKLIFWLKVNLVEDFWTIQSSHWPMELEIPGND